MSLPPDHPQRTLLSDEVHARPPEALAAPLRISYLALVSDPSLRDREWRHLSALLLERGLDVPPPGANHVAVDLGGCRLKWERHTEFSRYMVVLPGLGSDPDDPFAEPALASLPEEWLSGIPGQVIAATHAALVEAGERGADREHVAARLFAGHALIGSSVAGGAATALTDFRIHPDGFGRLLVETRSLAPRQAGRIVQRLLEIDTYKTMALLALPVARELAPALGAAERELAEITTALAHRPNGAGEATDEGALLDRLTRLEAELESRGAATHFRFGAAAAYYGLVRQRIDELREDRIEGLQTFREFVERRLAPAMGTTRSAAERQEGLAARLARATQLLSTRVEVNQARQNQALLHSMDSRARLQLRLQETVEGLSIAAVTYYIVGLVGYAVKGLAPLGLGVAPDIAMAASIPLVLLLTALGIRRIRRSVAQGGAGPG